MKHTPVVLKLSFAAFAAGVSLLLVTPGRADTLTFNRTPASNAVAQLSRRYGISIVFRGAVSGSQSVTFSVEDADTPAGRLQAVNNLANALGMDFQKVYVVSKIDPGTKVPDVKIDNDSLVIFPAAKVSAREAIQTIASVDGAVAQISGAVDGTVVFPNRRTTAAKAAATVARQTQTVWKAYYGLFKRGQGPARLNGDVVDQTTNGQPITALPLETFQDSVAKANQDSAGSQNANNGFGNGYGSYPYGYDPSASGIPYGYDPSAFGNQFAYDPYGYGGFGYPAPNGGVAYPGNVYTPGAGVEPAIPGVNAPGIFPPGSSVTTIPTTNQTVLPDYPFLGDTGPVIYGGY